jgi:hypothetical protein
VAGPVLPESSITRPVSHFNPKRELQEEQEAMLEELLVYRDQLVAAGAANGSVTGYYGLKLV